MPSSIKLPYAVSPRFAIARAFGAGIGAGFLKLPWRHAAMLSFACAALGSILWWVWR